MCICCTHGLFQYALLDAGADTSLPGGAPLGQPARESKGEAFDCFSHLLASPFPTRAGPGGGDRPLYGLMRRVRLPRLTACSGATGWPSTRHNLALEAVLSAETHIRSTTPCAGVVPPPAVMRQPARC